MEHISMNCCFCGSDRLALKYKGARHRFNKISGLINIYTCLTCRSLLTLPLPSTEELSSMYSSFGEGMSPRIRKLRNENPLTAWYRQCLNRATALMNPRPKKESSFTWIDIGAGGGEFARLMAEEFPASTGVAVDFHECPPLLRETSNTRWISLDLNAPFSGVVDQSFDLVVSITVIEHLLDPENLVSNCTRLMGKNAGLYITAPCADSQAEKILGRRWPYMIPGEHLNIPSVKGMTALLGKCRNNYRGELFSRKTILPYTAGYFLSFFRLGSLRKIFPHSLPLRIPTGILEAGFSATEK